MDEFRCPCWECEGREPPHSRDAEIEAEIEECERLEELARAEAARQAEQEARDNAYAEMEDWKR